MKLYLPDIDETTQRLSFEEPTQAVNARLAHGGVCDYELPGNARVDVQYYRSGMEIFLWGTVSGPAIGHCARCLESYAFDLRKEFSLVLVPEETLPPRLELALDDLDLVYYRGEEIDVSPLVDEQIILALPTKPLCTEECRGLCPGCGVNLNSETCSCRSGTGDPRWAALRQLKLDL